MRQRGEMAGSDAAMGAAGRGVSGRRRSWPLAVAGICGLALLMAACGGDNNAGSGTPTATPIPNVTLVAGQNTATPTQVIVGGQGAQVGVNDICTAQAHITASVPSNVPAYPGAELRITESGEYGWCSSAAAGDIGAYYVAQLPGKGWQSVSGHALGTGQQVTALSGRTSLVATIMPDTRTIGKTNILIVLQS